MKRTILLFFSLTILLSACINKDCREHGNYNFEIPATLFPAQDSFHIGDTIKITSIFPDDVFDLTTEEYYKLENFNFFPGTELVKIDTNPASEGLSDFIIIIPSEMNYAKQTFSEGEQLLVGEYLYDNNQYSLEFSLIPLKTGLYYMEQTTFVELSEDQDFEGKCDRLSSGSSVNLNDGSDNNFNLLYQSPDSHYSSWITSKPNVRFHRFGGYCFYVVE